MTFDYYYLIVSAVSLGFLTLWFFKPLIKKSISQFIVEGAADKEDAIALHFFTILLAICVSLLMPFLLVLSPLFIVAYLFARVLVKKNYN